MAFSDFKSISQVQEQFHIRYVEEHFIAHREVFPSEEFQKEFEFNLDNMDVYISEASRCETIIFPILREVYKQYADRCALWIQRSIAYDEHLHGTPDYVVATKSELGKTVLGMPLLIVVEAKRNDFQQGWGQCLAALVAAQQLNDDTASSPVFGIVTDGTLWEFGKLLGNVFTKNRGSYTVDTLPSLFGALMFVFDSTQHVVASEPV